MKKKVVRDNVGNGRSVVLGLPPVDASPGDVIPGWRDRRAEDGPCPACGFKPGEGEFECRVVENEPRAVFCWRTHGAGVAGWKRVKWWRDIGAAAYVTQELWSGVKGEGDETVRRAGMERMGAGFVKAVGAAADAAMEYRAAVTDLGVCTVGVVLGMHIGEEADRTGEVAGEPPSMMGLKMARARLLAKAIGLRQAADAVVREMMK